MTLRRGAFLAGLASIGRAAPSRAGGFARALVVTRSRREFSACEAAWLHAAQRRLFPARYERTSAIRGLRGRFPSANGTVEVWCLEDLLPPGRDAADPAQLARILPAVAGGNSIALVAALGNAASPTQETQNGDVVIGAQTFAHPGGHASSWRPRQADALVTSALGTDAFRNVIGSPAERNLAAPLLVAPPLLPVRRPAVIADRAFVALAAPPHSFHDSARSADAAALQAYAATASTAPVGCIDLLPALVRDAASAPFFFIAAITHRAGDPSDPDVARFGEQQSAAAWNAGMALAAMAIRMLYFIAD